MAEGVQSSKAAQCPGLPTTRSRSYHARDSNLESGTINGGRSAAQITGHAVNDGNVTLSYAEIWATFYDTSDVIIGRVLTNTLDLKENEIWLFWIYYFKDSEPQRYELEIANLTY